MQLKKSKDTISSSPAISHSNARAAEQNSHCRIRYRTLLMLSSSTARRNFQKYPYKYFTRISWELSHFAFHLISFGLSRNVKCETQFSFQRKCLPRVWEFEHVWVYGSVFVCMCVCVCAGVLPSCEQILNYTVNGDKKGPRSSVIRTFRCLVSVLAAIAVYLPPPRLSRK